MNGQTRMSPITALFLGLFGVGAVGIASGTAITLYAMRVIDTTVGEVISFADGTLLSTLENLPKIIESLPPSIQDLLDDERRPEYASQIAVTVNFLVDPDSKRIRPVMTLINNGSEVVSLLAIRVAALNENNLPVREWTEVVATPLALDDPDWRGPLFPGSTRYVVLSSSSRGPSIGNIGNLRGVVEISELRVWGHRDEM